MLISFNCPNCSAPLEVDMDSSTTIRCPYCNTLVVVPDQTSGNITGSSEASSNPASNISPSQGDDNAKLEAIRQLAFAGNRLGAIKLTRDTFEIGLKQAADLVDAIQSGEKVDLHQLQVQTPQTGQSSTLNPVVMQQITDRIKAGDKIGAIKLIRQATDAGLKEAKDTVDRMDAALLPYPEGANPETSSSPFSATKVQTTKPATGIFKIGGCIISGSFLFLFLIIVVPLLIGLSSPGGPLWGTWSRINPFAAARLTLAFGKQGTAPGYFEDARYISVDNNGHIFVGEFNDGRVQVFDENGNYLTQWVASGESTGEPYLAGMAAGRDGSIYAVVDSLLFAYDGLNGKLLGRLDHPAGEGFKDVALSSAGSVVATWYSGRDDIVRFDHTGQLDLLVKNAIENITRDSEMDTKIAVNNAGNIYALSNANGAVFIFSPDGRFISRFGSKGDSKGQFSSPTAIAIDNQGRIYIADSPGVLIYASDGHYLNSLRVFGAVMGLAIDDQNNLYLVANNQVLRYKLR